MLIDLMVWRSTFLRWHSVLWSVGVCKVRWRLKSGGFIGGDGCGVNVCML